MIVGIVALDLLEGHFAVQFAVMSHRDLSQTALGMQLKNPKS
jgi:hypothetical protein